MKMKSEQSPETHSPQRLTMPKFELAASRFVFLKSEGSMNEYLYIVCLSMLNTLIIKLDGKNKEISNKGQYLNKF